MVTKPAVLLSKHATKNHEHRGTRVSWGKCFQIPKQEARITPQNFRLRLLLAVGVQASQAQGIANQLLRTSDFRAATSRV